jgi:DNA-binding response OmpR family regulator
LQDAVVLKKVAKDAPRGKGETILVVEDEETVRLILADVLEELGYNVLLASDARPAIPILQSDRRIDLMVSDVMLPHINGRKLAEIARASRPDLKVLFVTGYAEDARSRGDFLEPGMDMMTKPFALDELGTKVRAIIER